MSIPDIGTAVQISRRNSCSICAICNETDSIARSGERDGQFATRHIPYLGGGARISHCQIGSSWVINQVRSYQIGVYRTIHESSELFAQTNIPDSGASVSTSSDQAGAIRAKSNGLNAAG